MPEPDSRNIKDLQSAKKAGATGLSFAFHGWTAPKNPIQAVGQP